MQDELLTIQRERDITIVFVSHDLNEAIRIGDRLAIMDDGEIVQIGTPRQLVLEPANDRVRSFLREADVRRVLTARDLAAEPPARLTDADAADLDAARERLEAAGELFLYATDADGRYRGVVSRDSIRAAVQRGECRIADAFLDDVATLPPDAPFARAAETVTGSTAPPPVVGDGGRLVGVVTARAMLDATGRED